MRSSGLCGVFEICHALATFALQLLHIITSRKAGVGPALVVRAGNLSCWSTTFDCAEKLATIRTICWRRSWRRQRTLRDFGPNKRKSDVPALARSQPSHRPEERNRHRAAGLHGDAYWRGAGIE